MSQIGLDSERDQRKDIRICNQHRIEKIEKECEWTDKNIKKRTTSVSMYLPTKNAIITPTKNNTGSQDSEFSSSSSSKKLRMNKGLGTDRFLTRQLQHVKESGANSEGICETSFALIQMWEEHEGRTNSINPVVASVAGIGEHGTNRYQKIKVPIPKTIPTTTTTATIT